MGRLCWAERWHARAPGLQAKFSPWRGAWLAIAANQFLLLPHRLEVVIPLSVFRLFPCEEASGCVTSSRLVPIWRISCVRSCRCCLGLFCRPRAEVLRLQGFAGRARASPETARIVRWLTPSL